MTARLIRPLFVSTALLGTVALGLPVYHAIIRRKLTQGLCCLNCNASELRR